MVFRQAMRQAALLLTFVSLGCDSSEPRGTGESANQSVTPRTVHLYSTPADSFAIEISRTPVVEIGSVEGSTTDALHDVRGAKRLRDGRIVVANGGSSELQVYDGAGRFLRAIGRSGEGPGEFGYLGGVDILSGDTLIALDIGLNRLVGFTADGEHLWTRPLKDASGTWLAEASPGDFTVSGEVISLWATQDRTRLASARPGTRFRESVAVLRHDVGGDIRDTIAVLPGPEYAVIEGAGGRPARTAAILGRQLTHAPGERAVFLGTQERYEVAEYTLEGRLSRRFLDTAVDLTATRADFERFAAPMVEQAGDDAAAQQSVRAYLDLQPVPSQQPAYGRLVMARTGELWISEAFSPFATPREWRVVNTDTGAYVQITVPENFEVYDIGEDYILGRWRDALGVEFVRVHELRRAS
jgi:hypothetical protein